MIEERIDELITQYKYRVSMCDDNLRTYMSDIQLTIKGCCALRDERGKRLDRLTRDIVVGKSLGIEGQLSQRRSRWTK